MTDYSGGHVCHEDICFVDRIHIRLVEFVINISRLVSIVSDKGFAHCSTVMTLTKTI